MFFLSLFVRSFMIISIFHDISLQIANLGSTGATINLSVIALKSGALYLFLDVWRRFNWNWSVLKTWGWRLPWSLWQIFMGHWCKSPIGSWSCRFYNCFIWLLWRIERESLVSENSMLKFWMENFNRITFITQCWWLIVNKMVKNVFIK